MKPIALVTGTGFHTFFGTIAHNLQNIKGLAETLH